MNNKLHNYPTHKAFEELLNSCGSMTSQLENMGHALTVELLKEGLIQDKLCRYTILKLDNIPVILALSHTRIENSLFVNILKNANNTPIGKFLFAENSKINRDSLLISKIKINNISDSIMSNYLLNNYHREQDIFSRESSFNSIDKQNMILTEIILPTFLQFFK